MIGNQRTLEEMDLLFAADTPWNWDAEKTYKRLAAATPQLVHAAKRSQSVVDPETGLAAGGRRDSYAAVYGNDTKHVDDSNGSGDEKSQALHL